MAGAKSKVVKRILIIVGIAMAMMLAATTWYVNDYYHADENALAIVAESDGNAEGIAVRTLTDGSLAFIPKHPTIGFIFYPGAKVQPESYAPLMQLCAEHDVLCVVVKPFFNLAIIDMNAADGVQEQFPDLKTWIIGGHSMGGVAAADYAEKHQGEFQGIVFLASYPANDLSGYAGMALSIAGENDQVLNRQSYDDARHNLPDDAKWIEIEGGNHAFFGSYGEQAGDGIATIARQSQQEQTADAIVELGKAL